jgi:hypothetical protein
MQRMVAQVALAAGVGEADRQEIATALEAASREIEGVVDAHAGVHLDLSVGGGDLTWDLLLEDDRALAALCAKVEGRGPKGFVSALGPPFAPLLLRVDSVEAAIPEPISEGTGRPGLVGIKRTLWLRVEPDASADARERFEAETPLLARAVPAIRNWRWSRVREVAPRPMPLRWTHLWEQEFETASGLEQDYMSSPCHWGYVDRWFDPEMPDRIVDLWLSHLACPEHAPVLSWEASAPGGKE